MQSFGLIANLLHSQISLPLTHIESRFRVTGDLASVEIDQIFEQNAREAINVTYTFPLPGEASVFRCEMHVNDRLVRAVVMEQKEARRFVEQKKAEGHQTALVEVNRENLFTLELGNVAPGDRIVIRFAYLQPLERLGDQLSLRIPFNPGVRYISGKPLLRANQGLGVCDDTDQVPDASRISPPRISRDHPGAATIYVRGSLDVDELTAGSLISPSHSVRVDAFEGLLEVELAGEEHVPDRDLVLRWQEPKVAEAKPKAWSSRQEEWRYGLVQLRAPEHVTAVDEWPQDIYFLLDRSGSMSGENWQQCTKALHAFVHELGPRDRIWITCFESGYQDFSDVPMLRDELLGDEVFQNFERIGTQGGTELLPALEHVLEIRAKHSIDVPARLILITDGQVGNERMILELMRGPQAARLPVHTFGIDRAVNDAFLQQLATESGGRCTLMTPQDDIPATVQKLGTTLRRPVLTNLQVIAGVEVPSPGQAMPDVHAGEVLLLPVRIKGSGVVKMSAIQPDGEPWSMEWDLDLAPLSETARLAWVKRRITHLEKAGCGPEAVEQAIHHNLLCLGASFVAWDETAKTAVAKIEVVQPAIETSALGEDMPGFLMGNILSASIREEEFQDEMPRFFRMSRKLACKVASTAPGGDSSSSAAGADLSSHELQLWSRGKRLKGADLSSHGIAEQRNSVPWLAAMKKFMEQKPDIPDELVQLLILALCHWAGQIIGQQRHKMIESWIKNLEASQGGIDELIKMLEPVSDPHVRGIRVRLREWKSGGYLTPEDGSEKASPIVLSRRIL